ncbi:MAG: CHRD domain-containing protein [Myxococcota bacterium]|nr:CHRD domain-containing protein [Myxococcota bacterium]
MTMNPRWITGLLALTLIVPFSGALADDDGRNRRRFVAFLDGFQEVPAVSTTARGSLLLRVDRRRGEIAYRLHTGPLEGNIWQVHLHLGRERTNGGVIAFLCNTVSLPVENVPDGTQECAPTDGGTISGTLDAGDILGPAGQGIEPGEIDEVIRALKRRAVYVNVHSGKFPAGEIRGQLR